MAEEPPEYLDDSDLNEFEGLFQQSRLRREGEQSRLYEDGGTSEGRQPHAGVIKSSGETYGTRVAPREKDLYKYNPSDKIAGHLTPAAANLTASNVSQSGAARAAAGGAVAGAIADRGDSPPNDVEELNEAETTKYHGYILNGMDGAGIAPIREEWLQVSFRGRFSLCLRAALF
jgi:hypothetical protein